LPDVVLGCVSCRYRTRQLGRRNPLPTFPLGFRRPPYTEEQMAKSMDSDRIKGEVEWLGISGMAHQIWSLVNNGATESWKGLNFEEIKDRLRGREVARREIYKIEGPEVLEAFRKS